jgi:hypothetical protein
VARISTALPKGIAGKPKMREKEVRKSLSQKKLLLLQHRKGRDSQSKDPKGKQTWNPNKKGRTTWPTEDAQRYSKSKNRQKMLFRIIAVSRQGKWVGR